jgi:hypothetical protein
VLVGDLDVTELLAHLRDDAGPQLSGERQHVRLVHQGEVLAPLRGPGEGVPHDPFDAERGVQAHLGGDLVRCAGADGPTGAGVGPLGALADDDEVDRGVTGQRAAGAGMQRRRTQVHMVVEREAQREQQPAFEHSAGYRRIADGAQQDRVVRAQFVNHAVGQSLTRRVIALRTKVVLGLLDAWQHDVEHLEGLGDDLGTDAVAGDDGEPQRGTHDRSTSSSVPAATSVPMAESTSAGT